MANLFEINRSMIAAWDLFADPETGELDPEGYAAFEQLQMERDAKVENIGCWIKNLNADAAALKEEAKAMNERAKRAERKAESLKRYLEAALAGEKFTSTRVAISWRRSTAVEIDEAEIPELPEQFLRVKTTIEPDKTAIKEALKDGEIIEGCRLVERTSIQIK